MKKLLISWRVWILPRFFMVVFVFYLYFKSQQYKRAHARISQLCSLLFSCYLSRILPDQANQEKERQNSNCPWKYLCSILHRFCSTVNSTFNLGHDIFFVFLELAFMFQVVFFNLNFKEFCMPLVCDFNLSFMLLTSFLDGLS